VSDYTRVFDHVDLEARIESHTELKADEALSRLVVVRELREETSRLESRDLGSSRGITVPASWLPLLVEGLEGIIEDEGKTDAAPDDDGEELAVDVKRIHALVSVLRDVPAGSGVSVSPSHHEALYFGLCDAVRWKEWLATRVGDHNNPPGLRFVSAAEFVALYEFAMTVEDISGAAQARTRCAPIQGGSDGGRPATTPATARRSPS